MYEDWICVVLAQRAGVVRAKKETGQIRQLEIEEARLLLQQQVIEGRVRPTEE